MFSTTEITSHEDVSDNVIHQRLFFAYVEAAKLVKGNVLEIGCGAGRGLQKIASVCDSYTAIDKNEELIAHHSNAYPDFTFINSHIPPLSELEDDTFDFVISFQVIEHIEDDDLFVKEISRVLKPGGKAIISTPNKEMSLTRNPWHIREYKAGELANLLNKYFSVVDVKGVVGSNRVNDYYERNKESVKKITRFDVLNLQYNLPRKFLQLPYEVLNRLNRKKLLTNNTGLVSEVTVEDYQLTNDAAQGYDFFCIAEK